MTDLKTFSVGWIFQKLADERGVNLATENIDDVCYGFVVSSDKTLGQVLQENAPVYNYQIVDGDPVRLVRRQVNDDLTIDFEIDESECIRRGPSPAILFSRVEPTAIPRQVEIQYIDPDRDYAMNTQVARHAAAPRNNNSVSIGLDFVLSAQQARDMAFDLLYRLWAQQLQVQFEHPDMSIEPSDIVRLTCSQGVFTCLVVNQTINMPNRTNSIEATILLASKGQTITAPTADPFDSNSNDDYAAWLAAA